MNQSRRFLLDSMELVNRMSCLMQRSLQIGSGANIHTLKVTAQHFVDYAEKVLWHLDQPIADQATVATYMVAKLAREHVKMVLTGEGGDELFAGYARYLVINGPPCFDGYRFSLEKCFAILPSKHQGCVAEESHFAR